MLKQQCQSTEANFYSCMYSTYIQHSGTIGDLELADSITDILQPCGDPWQVIYTPSSINIYQPRAVKL